MEENEIATGELSEEYSEKLEMTQDMQNKIFTMLDNSDNHADVDKFKESFLKYKEENESYPNGKTIFLEDFKKWVASDGFPAEKRKEFESHIANIEKNLKQHVNSKVELDKPRENLELEVDEFEDSPESYPAFNGLQKEGILANDGKEPVDTPPNSDISKNTQSLGSDQNQPKPPEKPKSYEIPEKDRENAEKLNSKEEAPKIKSEIVTGIPPQVWLIAINTGGMLLACMIPGGALIYAAVLLADLKILPKFPSKSIRVKTNHKESASNDKSANFGNKEIGDNPANFGDKKAKNDPAAFGNRKTGDNPAAFGDGDGGIYPGEGKKTALGTVDADGDIYPGQKSPEKGGIYPNENT
ncbi:MAG: hypothetical protein LBP39_03330, partial [Rickettsiales bacterium]|nr:hypothetical protein [Rickettsiales bacterium]